MGNKEQRYNELLKSLIFPEPEYRREIEKIPDDINEILNKNTEPKEFEKVVKKIENAIRTLPEYKEWAKRRASEYQYCQLCKIPFDETGLRREVHHTPLTLYEIVVQVINELIDAQEHITSAKVIGEVINRHLSNEVGSLVLCPCCHKRLHYERKEYGAEYSLDKLINEMLDQYNQDSND